jgi:hypothetical protein
MKLNINSVEVHPHVSNNGHSVDGALVGAGSLWPSQLHACKKTRARDLVFLKGSSYKSPFTVATACLGFKTPAHH